MKRKNNLLVIFSTVIFSILNEIYLRLFADFYVNNFYQSSVPEFGSYFSGFLGRLYLDLVKIPFLTFIFIQIIFLLFVFILLSRIIKQKINVYKLFTASIIFSIISYVTATPYYINKFFLALTSNYELSFITYFIIIIHTLILSSAFYFFTNKKNK